MFINLFPHRLTGVEIASIFAIFTSMAWNMTFSVYQSILAEPGDLQEAADVLHMNGWQRFLHLDAPVSAIGLVWNGMMSFGGAWFFLAASEAISVMGQNIQLPGVGTYLAVATTEGDFTAMFYAVITMFILIVLIDQLFWRPLVVWSRKFKIELSESGQQPSSWLYEALQRSWLMNCLVKNIILFPCRAVNKAINFFADAVASFQQRLARDKKKACRRWGYKRSSPFGCRLFSVSPLAEHLVEYQ